MLANYVLYTLVAFLIYWILQIVAYWSIFKKAGEPGWKSIIPIYCTYVQYKLTWKTSMFWISFLAAIIANVLMQLGGDSLALLAVGVVLEIAAAAIGFVALYKLSRSFGHGVGFAIGLIFLYPIFILILGFGSSQYIGNMSE